MYRVCRRADGLGRNDDPIRPSTTHARRGADGTPVAGLPASPSFICGLSVVNESVIYGSGTNDPGNIPGVAANVPGVIKSTDGGRTWVRKPVNDQQGNANLEGIGFIDEDNGWVGGWGDRFFRGGFSSATADGATHGATRTRSGASSTASASSASR